MYRLWDRTSQVIINLANLTVEPRHNDLWYNDIPDITFNIFQPSQYYSKMYLFNDPRYNDIPDITITF